MHPYAHYAYQVDPTTGCFFPEHSSANCPQPLECPYHRPSATTSDSAPGTPALPPPPPSHQRLDPHLAMQQHAIQHMGTPLPLEAHHPHYAHHPYDAQHHHQQQHQERQLAHTLQYHPHHQHLEAQRHMHHHHHHHRLQTAHPDERAIEMRRASSLELQRQASMEMMTSPVLRRTDSADAALGLHHRHHAPLDDDVIAAARAAEAEKRLRLGSGMEADGEAEARRRNAALMSASKWAELTQTASTKGASKQRRDMINSEISNLRDMLPLPESARQRLSQLQIMSLACCYVRKCNYFSRLFDDLTIPSDQPFEFSQAMTGFLLIATREGKMLYISENITDYLGHSMVDMLTQGDSIYDIIDKRDHEAVQAQLTSSPTGAVAGGYPATDLDVERTFFCRMNVSRSFRRQGGYGDQKMMHVRGHFIQPRIRDHYSNQSVFMAICSPLITPDVKEAMVQNNTMTFQSVHGLDMKFIEIAPNGEHHLGYSDSEMVGKSWYEMIHPEDTSEAKEKHVQLVKSSHEMGCMLTVRLMTRSGEWIWVNTVMHIRQPFLCDNADPAIVCINQVISEAEAAHFKLQSQLYSSHIARSPEFLPSPQGASPPHTITQVTVEPEYNISFHAMRQDMPQDAGFFQGDFGIAVTTQPLIGDAGSNQMRNGDGSHTQGTATFPTGHTLEKQNKPRRVDILNELKRKIGQQSQRQSQQCKPAKIPRYNNHGNNNNNSGQGGITVHGSAFIANDYFRNAGLREMGGDGGGLQMMGMVDVPIFAQLNMKKAIQPPVSSPYADFHPLTPPTPAAAPSPSASMDDQTTSLTIDVSMAETMNIPPSILTPAASPPYSPSTYSPYPRPPPSYTQGTEQTVPNELVDVEEVLISDIESKTMTLPTKVKSEPQETKNAEQSFGLPVLDVSYLETFLSDVEKKPETPVVIPKIEPCCSVGSPESFTDCSNQGEFSSDEEDFEACPSSSDARPGLSEADAQLNSFMDTLLGMMNDGSSSSASSSSVCMTSSSASDVGVMGGFMLVPNASGCQTQDVTTGSPNPTDSDLEMTSQQIIDDVMNSVQHHDLLLQLNQLNQLAASSPSHGDDGLSASLFEQDM